MLQMECPWCDGPATVEPVAGDDATFSCPDCSVRVEVTGAPTLEVAAIAA